MKALMSGNEAVARGAYEIGVNIASAYPGTPSTEILENIAKYNEIYCTWSTNEKTAFDFCSGASFGGARVLVAMKHVGLNVAADPFFSLSHIGATGGFVVVTCDDPGMHSSQNEQDNRHYARAAKVPLLEPSSSQEAKDFVKIGIQISEEFDTPVLLRLTTRISHSKALVHLSQRKPHLPKGYKKEFSRRVLLPLNARKRHEFVEERLKRLKEYSERFEFNRVENGDSAVGVVTSGVAYNYVKEVFPTASVLKLSMSYPFPSDLVRRFLVGLKTVYVVEENDPFVEQHIRALGFDVVGKERIPLVGELDASKVALALGLAKRDEKRSVGHIPSRPPVLCPGCPHAGVFYVLSKLKLVATGDIGCYTLGGLPPLNSMDTCVSMGSGIGNALGLEKALGESIAKNLVAVLGDSTFFHTGIPPLIDILYNKGMTTVLILDNRTTAMTGHQHHPGTGRTLMGEPTSVVDLVKLCRGLGVRHTYVVDPYDLKQTERIIKREVHREAPSVVIARRECVLLTKRSSSPLSVNLDECTGCRLCLRLGCPAITVSDKHANIEELLCTACRLCAQICPQDAIV
jgi:indolepyruvate ferredoxin oxidoreductase alpha subunit